MVGDSKMKKILVLFCCLFVLSIITILKSDAEEPKQVRGLHGGVLFFRTNPIIKPGEDLKFVIFEQEPAITVPGYPKAPMLIKVNGKEYGSVGAPVESLSYPYNMLGITTTVFLDYQFVIPVNDLPTIGINGLGEYTLAVLFAGQEIGEGGLRVIVTENPSSDKPTVPTGPSSQACISCLDSCCISRENSSFTKGSCTKDIEVSCRNEDCLASCTEETTEKPVTSESADTEALESLTEDLADLQEDLLAEYEDSKIRALRSVSSKLKRVIRLLESAVENSNEDPESCSDDLQDSISALETVISRLESKSCATKRTKRCISEDIAEDLGLEFEDILEELDFENSIDDNQDNIPDACGSIN